MARKKRRDHDFAVTAYHTLEQVIKNTEATETETVKIDGKNPHAVALGKLGGSKGGKARANRLTPEQRKEIAKLAAKARWKKS